MSVKEQDLLGLFFVLYLQKPRISAPVTADGNCSLFYGLSAGKIKTWRMKRLTLGHFVLW